MTYKIEKNIPLAERSMTSNPLKVILAQMDVNDSILVNDRTSMSSRSIANDVGAATKFRFSIRKIDDNSHRIWRIS